MPNFCVNLVIPKEPESFKKDILNEEKEVDFNKVIPMPNEVCIPCCSHSYPLCAPLNDAERWVLDKIKPLLDAYYTDNISQAVFTDVIMDKLISLKMEDEVTRYYGRKAFDRTPDRHTGFDNSFAIVIQGYYNLQRFGCRDWYDWSLAHWGCKWNASENFISDNDISFNTPWGPPDKVFEELARRHDFVVLMSEESPWLGYGIAKDGVFGIHDLVLNTGAETVLAEMIEHGSSDIDTDFGWMETEPTVEEREEAKRLFNHFYNYWRQSDN